MLENTRRRITTDTERLVYENQYARIYDNDVTFPRNVRGRYLKFDWTAPYGVAVLPVLEDGALHLVNSFRYASDEWSIEIPKGFGAADVPPAEMALQELRQETWLACTDIRRITSLKTEPGLINHFVHLFVAYDCHQAFALSPEDTEVFGAPLVVTCADAIRLIDSETITDSLTANAIFFYYRATSP